jgi:hypothetical protein
VILVTGTKRSGTSMWMQILRDAGYAIVGDAFPKDWGETIREANPRGFFESPLRNGIYYATNPNPRTGAYIAPDAVRDAVVKVFVPGLVRSDLAYIGKVVACVRDYRAYPGSIARLLTMEHTNRQARLGKSLEPLPAIPPLLEWWSDNFALLADHFLRRYPVKFVAYERVLAEPDVVVRDVLAWLGTTDEAAIARARAVVTPELTTQGELEGFDASQLAPRHEVVFRAMYERMRSGEPFDRPLIETLNALEEELGPTVDALRADVKRERREVRRKRRANEQTR